MMRRAPSPLWLTLPLLAGCHGSRADNGPSAAASGDGSAFRASDPLPYSREGIAAFVAALRQRCRENCSILMLELSPARVLVQMESKEKLGQLEQYEWRTGTLSGPVPIELRGKGTLAQNLFPLAAIDLNAVPPLVEAAIAKIDREHGALNRVLIRRNLPEDDGVGMRVYVDSPRKSGQVDADARGRVLGS